MSDATVQDELAFEELPLETKELVQRLADSGYFGDDDCVYCEDLEAEIDDLNLTISELREEIEELKETIEELENA